MQQKRAAPSSSAEHFHKSPLHNLALYVPFSWEEKPGVPKKQESNLLVNCVHFPAPPCMHHHHCPAAAISPLRKPPRLQQNFAPLICKTPSFNSISAAPRFNSRFLLRRQSFDNIIYGDDHPLTREYSHESFILHQSWNARGQPGTLIRMEDDPFFMALQACTTSEPIKVFYHHDRSCTSKVCEEERAVGRKSSRRIHGVEDGVKHLTIRELFSQQSQEGEQLQKKTVHKQPLEDGKEQGNRRFTFVARCFGCF